MHCTENFVSVREIEIEKEKIITEKKIIEKSSVIEVNFVWKHKTNKHFICAIKILRFATKMLSILVDQAYM